MNKSVCYVCELIWSLTMVGGAAYLVFGQGRSGWLILLGIVLASCWNCNKITESA